MYTNFVLESRFHTYTKQIFSKQITGYRSNGIQQ